MDIHRFEQNLARLERSPLPARHPTVIDRNTFTETEEEAAQRFNFDENQKKQADQSRRHMAAFQTEAETAMIPPLVHDFHGSMVSLRRRDAHLRAADAMKAASISSVEHHHRLTEVAEAAAVAAPFRFTSGGRRGRNKNRRTKNRRTKNRRKRKKSMK